MLVSIPIYLLYVDLASLHTKCIFKPIYLLLLGKMKENGEQDMGERASQYAAFNYKKCIFSFNNKRVVLIRMRTNLLLNILEMCRQIFNPFSCHVQRKLL